mmetsp:Transcript_15375/g.23075  ORF Transcript_15375/g.23075 Transcript_15375/m.23075 type:complete len:313 (-) Transcript_15375:153-1091(-)
MVRRPRYVQTGTSGSWNRPWLFSQTNGSCRSFSSSSSGSSAYDGHDPYKVLGVDRNASADEIKAAYRKQALQWHPDRHPPDKRKDAERRFSAAANAYEILSDPQKRKQCDSGGATPNGPGFPGGAYSYGDFPGGSIHSQEAAERLFKQVFGGRGMDLFEQLLGQQTPNLLQAGMDVRVLSDAKSVLKACRSSDIDSTFDALRTRSLGKRGRILKVDPRDQSVKVAVEGVGNVWFGAGAVRRIGGGGFGANFGANLGDFGGFGMFGNSAGGSVVQMKQEMITLPDGRRAIRVTRVVQQPDGSFHQETSETPLG